eukprot:gene34390-biopygen28468
MAHAGVAPFCFSWTEGKSKDLKEAIGLAYEGVARFDTQVVYRCVALLKHSVESGTAHVLCCRETPSAKPVYYIFEDSSRPSEEDTLQFTDDYLQNERRKFTGLTYVTKLRSPPWVANVLLLLEKRLRAPTSAAVVEEERDAHMAHRPDHTDGEVEDMRQDAVNRFTEALSPVPRRRRSRRIVNLLAKLLVNVFMGVARMQRGGDPTEQPSLRPWTACTSSPHKARLHKPRFAARWTQLRYNLMLHRVAQAIYVAPVFVFVIFAAAGGSSRLTHGRVENDGVLTRFELTAGGCGWRCTCRSVHGASPFARDAWGGDPCTSWEAQHSSRQWEPGWEANVAEQDEVLPYTMLDELQRLGATTVTKDEAAWLDPELNATCKDCFANTPHALKGYTGEATHNTFSIPLKDESKAVYQRPRKYSPGKQEIIDIHCKELLEYGFIEPASKYCRHASNVVVAGKKDHASGLWTQKRFCVDLRGINRHSLKDSTLPHRPEELYQKIPMATEEDRDKTAFWWKNQLYRYTSMPFGAAGATAAFVRIMDYVLRHLQHCTVAYVDDIVIYTDTTAEQHLKDVEEVLQILANAGIRLHSDWLGIDQKLSQHVTEDDSWAFIGDYATTYIYATHGKSVIRPKNTGMTTDRSKLRRLQQEVEMLQKYPSGEVAGILIWDRGQRVFCVQPEAVKQHIDLMEATLDHGGFDNSRELRAAIVKKLMVHAGCNLEIAQHRDTLRYEHRRSGSYEPKPHQFKAGDFVYIRQQPRSGMEVATKPAILKLVKVQKDGVVVLEDSTKLREKSTVQNIAPCHLQENRWEAAMLLCDTCNRGFHIWCLEPALDEVPEGDWQCPKCLGMVAVAAAAVVSTSLVEKMAAMELQLREKLGTEAVLLPADVGPCRAVRPGREHPWQALTSRQMLKKDGSMGDLPDRVAWGNQEEPSRVITNVMPGFWHEGHRTILSRKCLEQHTRARSLRKAATVQAMSPEEVQKRGGVTQLSRAQVKIASQLNWGLELVMTVPQEVRRLAHEVTWEKVTQCLARRTTVEKSIYAWCPISRSLSKTERQYASFKGEMLALVVWEVRTLRQYLHGVHFTLVTDHSSLTTLMEKSDLQGQHLRWAISLQEFDFTVQYRPREPRTAMPTCPRAIHCHLRRIRLGQGMNVKRYLHFTQAWGNSVKRVSVTACASRWLVTLPSGWRPRQIEMQVANYCKMVAREQLGTGPVHRLFDLHYREELEFNHTALFDTDHPELVVDIPGG